MESYPFTSKVTFDSAGNPIFDRAVDSTFLRRLNQKDRCDGVVALHDSSAFYTEANEEMTVLVHGGYCFIRGANGYEKQNRVMSIQASSTRDRIDTVVLRLNDSMDVRAIDLYVIKGEPSDNPVPPVLTRSTEIWELGIANIYIPAGTVNITQERITDTRLDSARCGYSVPFQELDTKNIFNQFTAAATSLMSDTTKSFSDFYNQAKEIYDTWYEGIVERVENDTYRFNSLFDTWFDSIRGKLASDLATALQMQIDDLETNVDKTIFEFVDRQTWQEEDGTIVQLYGDGRKITTKELENGAITQKLYNSDGVLRYTKNITTDANGVIHETVI